MEKWVGKAVDSIMEQVMRTLKSVQEAGLESDASHG